METKQSNLCRKATPWSLAELDTLRRLYKSDPLRLLARRLDRSVSAIANKAWSLGLSRKRYWTEAELTLLKNLYPTKGGRYLCELLNRNRRSVHSQVRRLGLSRERKPHDAV